MLLRLRMYDVSRLIRLGTDRTIPNLDVSIAQMMKIKPTYLATIQRETQSDATLRQLRETIMKGWPESMNDLTDSLKPYWCFRDELAVIDRQLKAQLFQPVQAIMGLPVIDGFC